MYSLQMRQFASVKLKAANRKIPQACYSWIINYHSYLSLLSWSHTHISLHYWILFISIYWKVCVCLYIKNVFPILSQHYMVYIYVFVDRYLSIPNILSAAISHECTMLHPGYGFLSENASFVDMCREQGINFIGPDVCFSPIFLHQCSFFY